MGFSFWAAFSFVIGLLSQKYGVSKFDSVLLLTLLLLLAFTLSKFSRVTVLMALIFSLLGWWRMDMVLTQMKALTPWSLNKTLVEVVQEPITKNGKEEMVVRTIAETESFKTLLVQKGIYPQYHYGDRLALSGKAEIPFVTKDFSYQEYLASLGINYLVRNPKIEKVGEGGSSFGRISTRMRNSLIQTSDNLFPEPQSSLLLGTLVGVPRELPPKFSEALRRTGLMHIVVVSGYNMMLVVSFFSFALRPFGRRWALLLSVVGISSYALFVGLSPPVFRAALVAIIAIFGSLMGRQRDALNVLALVACIILIVNPWLLLSVSFQLSFLAALGMLWFSPRFLSVLDSLTRLELWREWVNVPLATTMGVTLMVFPILTHTFQTFSLTFLPANLVAALLIEPIMLLGALALISSYIIPLASPVLVYIADIPLRGLIFTAQLMSKFSLSSTSIIDPGLPFWIGYYLCLFFILWLTREEKYEGIS